MRSRQKPSLFKSSIAKCSVAAAASFAFLPGGSMLSADEPVTAAQIARRTAANEIASLPKLPARTAMQPTQGTPLERLSTADLTDSVILNSRSFGIPFNVDNTGTRPVEVHLFVSRGKDSEWKLLDRKPPTVKEFQFNGTDDGPYWFATRTIDADGNAQPESHLAPQLRVFVDTTKPGVNLEVEADASGRVAAAFTYKDRTPIKSIQIHYATDVLREWTKLNPRDAVAKGQIKFTPKENWQQLSLQIITTDAANNRTVTSKLIQRPRIATGKTPDYAVIDSYDDSQVQEDVQLVAGGQDTLVTNGKRTPKPSMYVHRADDTNRSIFVTSREAKPTDNDETDLPTAKSEAKIAQVPTYTNPTTRRSPQPVTNSFFRPGQAGPGQKGSVQPNASPAFDPRQNDPRSLAIPNTQTNQFGSGVARQMQAFGPPSVTENRKQYQLVRPAPTQPEQTTAVPPNSFAPSPHASTPNIMGANAIDPNAPPIPRGMSAPGGMSMPPTMARPAMTMPTTPPYQPTGQYPTTQYPTTQSPATRTAVAQNPGRISLPPASTPDQISKGFGGLNMPDRRQTFAATEKADPPPASQPPTKLSIDRELQKPRASRTVAEAMRPLEPNSANSNRQQVASQAGPKKKPIDVDSPAYRAMRQSQAAYDQALLADRTVVRYSDSERFSLEYELEAVGASGAEAVELYGSTNAGQNWKRWGDDPDLISPFDIETKGEGTFAFKIVVISRNGLASPRPLSGETPDIVVIVDKSKPDVKITDVKYGEGERTGSLVIRYDCKDTNLMQRPIALSFSDSPDGPWTTIAAGLRNEGDYVWPGDPELPRQIYLRIDAKDLAGNDGSYLLEEPIDSQGLAPRARIRGFRSLSERGFVEPQDQTAGRPGASFK